MARVTIEFSTDNAAFADDFEGETARVLNDIAERLPNRAISSPMIVRDINGKYIGEAIIDD